MTQLHISDRERARLEASDWCARMNGGAAIQQDVEFENWLAQSALNRQIFSEISELYRFGEGLSRQAEDRNGQVSEKNVRLGQLKVAGLWALAAVLLSIAATAIFTSMSQEITGQAPRVFEARRIAAETHKRIIALPDGSSVILDANSRLSVSIDTKNRLLRLESGRARFEVAHDKRPFIVTAGNGSVRALGTIFDVTIMEERSVRVDLLRGAVDVSATRASASGAMSSKARLAAGQSASFDLAGTTLTASPRSEAAAKLWPEGLMTYNGARLSEVIEQANQYGTIKIGLGSGALADRRVYGTLKIDDPQALSKVLARSQELDLLQKGGEIILEAK